MIGRRGARVSMRMSIVRLVRHVFLVGVCLLIGLSLLAGLSGEAVQAAGSGRAVCMSTAHCYGINRWYAGSSFAGAYTSISTIPLYTNNHGIHIFTHEMWLEENSARCSANLYHNCWIEVGYGNFHASYNGTFYAGMFYFWADMRPGASNLLVHILGPVGSAQFGRMQNYHIRRINSTVYEVMAGNYIAYSTQNTMVANTLTIGEELANDGGLASTSAQPAYFMHTAWLDSYGWHFFQNSGQVVDMNPHTAKWVSPNLAGGRAFYTACCVHK